MKALWFLLSLQLCLVPAVFAQDVKDRPPPPVPGGTTPQGDEINTRMRVRGSVYTGEEAPDFELPSSTGHEVHLSTFRPAWTLLVFAERKEGLLPLATIRDEMAKLGVKIVGVCDEKAYFLVAHVQKEDPGFPMLADVTGEISGLYGLYDPARRTTEPGFFVIDPHGMVRLALLGQQIRPPDMAGLVYYAVRTR